MVDYGTESVLQREYDTYVANTEAGYDFIILIDLETQPSTFEEREVLIRRKSLMKWNVVAALSEKAFVEFSALSDISREIHLRVSTSGRRGRRVVMSFTTAGRSLSTSKPATIG
jgi:actin related protein 2/3 complex subunit 2